MAGCFAKVAVENAVFHFDKAFDYAGCWCPLALVENLGWG